MLPARFQSVQSSKVTTGTLILLNDKGHSRFGLILNPIKNGDARYILILGPWEEGETGPVTRLEKDEYVVDLGSQFSIEESLDPKFVSFQIPDPRPLGCLSIESQKGRIIDVLHAFSGRPAVVSIDNLALLPNSGFVEGYDVTFRRWNLVLASTPNREDRITLFTWTMP
jgi:hypothetical protein